MRGDNDENENEEEEEEEEEKVAYPANAELVWLMRASILIFLPQGYVLDDIQGKWSNRTMSLENTICSCLEDPQGQIEYAFYS
ncbi:uncharacterized protein H6S33_001081 [Morchella sextelata]|uniref:uncharacterized protein n=1 Tax=Morchella sextelata TaxID=1174677 RepID=UPI001D038782|nr:uncharacterized protein H6S33_001081 [Morchella sextelata]KAH0608853.1 hypothetical protein H6S33_001081 [Morchella sextelata]